MQWYYIVDGVQNGPIEQDAFFALAKSGQLKPTDYVWNQTMGQQWAEALTIPGLFGAGPPPVKQARLHVKKDPAEVEKEAAAQAAQEAEQSAPVVEQVNIEEVQLSCTRWVRPSWERTKDILFRPFDMVKWFMLGFTAWLATLGEGGGGGGSTKFKKTGGGNSEVFSDAMVQANAFMNEHAGSIALIVAIGFIVSVGLWVLAMWIRCRGKFMFLDNVVHNRADVSNPWNVFKQHASSLFKWNLVYGLLCFVVSLPVLMLVLFKVAMPCIRAGAWDPAVIPMLVLAVILSFPLSIVTGYINRFREDFIIPIMYNLDLTATEAWGRFIPVLKCRLGALIVYGLFYTLLIFLALLCVFIFCLATCCIGGCLIMIPYIGSVVLLPMLVFFRQYSLNYLDQFGPVFHSNR